MSDSGGIQFSISERVIIAGMVTLVLVVLILALAGYPDELVDIVGHFLGLFPLVFWRLTRGLEFEDRERASIVVFPAQDFLQATQEMIEKL